MNLTPSPVKLAAGLAVAMLLAPLVALVATAPWGEVPDRLVDGRVVGPLVLSLVTSTVATVVVAVIGIPLGWILARNPSWAWVRPLVLVPLLLPPVVVGVVLQQTWGPTGLLGGPLESLFGLVVPFTSVGVVLVQTFVALPFCVLAVESGVRGIDPRAEELAGLYGITGTRLLRRVTLPLAGPGIGAGLALAFARALGEFGATLTFAGNLPGRTRTAPLAVYFELQSDPASAVLLSLLLLAVSIGVLVALRGRLGLTT